MYSDDIGFDLSDIGDAISDAGEWVGGAVATAGSAVGSAAGDVIDFVADTAETIGKGLDAIPVIGSLLSAAWSGATSPFQIAQDVSNGVPLDQVAMNAFERELKNIKDVAPYAQTVISFVPAIGPVASGAISAGIALANGQPIDQVLIAGVKGAIPGGPLAAAAFDASVGIMQGKSIEEIGVNSVSNLGKAIGVNLPPDVSKYLASGLQVAKGVASGERVDTAIVNEAIAQLPPEAQKAANAARDIGNGAALSDILIKEGIDRAGDKLSEIDIAQFGVERFTAQVRRPFQDRVNPSLRMGLSKAENTARTAKAVRAGKIRAALKGAIAPGIAMGTGGYFQLEMKKKILEAGGELGDLERAGLYVAATVPSVGAISKIPPKVLQNTKASIRPMFADEFRYGDLLWQQGEGFAGENDHDKDEPYQRGFLIGAGLMTQKINPIIFTTIRSLLTPQAQVGFDTAVSVHIAKAKGVSPAFLSGKEAGAFLATLGMRGASPNIKGDIAKNLVKDPEEKAGIKKGLEAIIAQK